MRFEIGMLAGEIRVECLGQKHRQSVSQCVDTHSILPILANSRQANLKACDLDISANQNQVTC